MKLIPRYHRALRHSLLGLSIASALVLPGCSKTSFQAGDLAAAALFAAVHTRIHGDNACRHFGMAYNRFGTIKFFLQRDDAWQRIVEGLNQLLQTLDVQAGEDDGGLG